MWQSLAGAGTLVERDGRVLMIHRERSGQTRWELPSGLVEDHESFEGAAIRETLEETGVQVALGELLCTAVMDVPDEAYRAVNVYFLATVQGNIHLVPGQDEPIERVEFVDVACLRSRDIHPVDRRILARWRKRRSSRPFYFRIFL